MNQGKLADAETLFRSCRDRVTRLPGFDEGEALFIDANLAWVLLGRDEAPAHIAEALRLLDARMPDFRRVWGEADPRTFTAMDSLGTALRLTGRPRPAAEWHRRALDGRRVALGDDHDDTLASRNNLAVSLQAAGRLADAEAEFRALLEVKVSAGVIGLRRPFHLYNLGLTLRDQGRLAEAERYSRDSYQLFRERSGPAHPETLTVAGGLFDLLVLQDRWADAERLLSDVSLDVYRRYDPASPFVADLRHRLGWARLKCGKFADAEADLRAGLVYREKHLPNVWVTSNTRSLLGGALLGQRLYADAEPFLLAGYAGLKQRAADIPPPAAARLPEAVDRLIALYTVTNRPDEVWKWRAERAKYGPEAAPLPRPVVR